MEKTEYQVNLGDFAPRAMTKEWGEEVGARMQIKAENAMQIFQCICLIGTRGEGTFIRWLRME